MISFGEIGPRGVESHLKAVVPLKHTHTQNGWILMSFSQGRKLRFGEKRGLPKATELVREGQHGWLGAWDKQREAGGPGHPVW